MRRVGIIGLVAAAGLASGFGSALARAGDDIMSGDEGMPCKLLPKRKKGKPQNTQYTPHPAMPEDGWPETRQQKRARERAELKRFPAK